jgi:hypothetical protein
LWGRCKRGYVDGTGGIRDCRHHTTAAASAATRLARIHQHIQAEVVVKIPQLNDIANATIVEPEGITSQCHAFHVCDADRHLFFVLSRFLGFRYYASAAAAEAEAEAKV